MPALCQQEDFIGLGEIFDETSTPPYQQGTLFQRNDLKMLLAQMLQIFPILAQIEGENNFTIFKITASRFHCHSTEITYLRIIWLY